MASFLSKLFESEENRIARMKIEENERKKRAKASSQMKIAPIQRHNNIFDTTNAIKARNRRLRDI